MRKSAEDVLEDLARSSNISLHSNDELVRAVARAATAADKERAKKKAEAKKPKNEDTALRRKPELLPIRAWNERAIPLTPWDVLHTLGRAIALSRRGAARGLAEHWGALKYSQALTDDMSRFMKLSVEGKSSTSQRYKAIQSNELGIGFALAIAERVLSHRYPDRVVSIVPADTALRAGWALTSKEKGTRIKYSYRPQFFAEVWKPGEPSLVVPVACKGSHSNTAYCSRQLASASAHVEAVHIGPWNETPALIFSTTLPSDKDRHVTVHALRAGGNGGWLSAPRGTGPGVDTPLEDVNQPPNITVPARGGEPPRSDLGFHITKKQFDWFARVVARTDAAGLTAFAGHGNATAQYLTKRQGKEYFETDFEHAAAQSVQDAEQDLLGICFSGTDHIFRLNGPRVEAFSGVARDLLGHLVRGEVAEYRRKTYRRRTKWPHTTWDDDWGGPVSIHPDGSVLAMRLLPEGGEVVRRRRPARTPISATAPAP
ncbi:hypothetical protein [Saccharopolyspora hordei]|uniref:Uncharacterized protein n=1 Tax=Saccharopolyspora hordei TaxID=1838 RepID=A0A853ARN2_9PSEU|nr:hypothetical protein [Saccharopolyspora hordei]NYI83987.1 hypothetical protein [Saccharopolyspora hordei]